ncbi:hypothetical protein [Bacillus phage CP-51]|uniref:Uncharacterized protein n=1 Tax=Bacillus phage CP-51 TaxID=1391188 RepID=A0A068EU97_9CAUD|nr:hypothetical protein OZ73_gp171 [Bacillus phage CP-51]AID50606.1 hypothetical protein [Bacillus phage CP-51]
MCVCGCRASFSPFWGFCECKGFRVQTCFREKFG